MVKLELGDVIQSEYFVFGWKQDFSNEVIEVSSSRGKHIRSYSSIPKGIPAERISVEHNKKARTRKVDNYLADLSVVDESRKNALYVVEYLRDVPPSPDDGSLEGGLLVHARRLNEDKTYNRTGELLRFYAFGDHQNTVYDFRKVGKMQMAFVNFQEGK